MRFLPRSLWPILLISCVLFAPACAPPAQPAKDRGDDPPLSLVDPESVETKGVAGGTLLYCLPGEPSSFNFVMAGDTRTQVITYLTTGTLLEFDRIRQEVVPGVAREWTVSADARAVTVRLREGLQFSDGVAVSSDDVLFTFEKIYEEGSENLTQAALRVDGERLSVTKLGPLDVRIEFPEPFAAAPYILTTVPVLPRHLLSTAGRRIEDYWNLSTPAAEMAGLGPFRVAEHLPAEKTVLERNPFYWKLDAEGRRLPYLDQLIIFYIGDRNNQLLRFQAGEIDLLDYQLRPEDYLLLQDESSNGQVLNVGPSSHLTFFWFNLSGSADRDAASLAPEKSSWFQDLRFRSAVSLAVSRETIARNIFLGQASPVWTLMPASIPAWHLDARKPRDLDKARALLKEAGFSWAEGSDVVRLVDQRGREVTFTLLTRSDAVYGKIAAVLQQDLAELGIEMSIQQEESRSVVSRVTRTRDYEAALMAIELPYEPADHVGILVSNSPNHFWNPAQPRPATEWEARIDRLMAEQVTEMDSSTRQAMYREVQQILLDNVAIIPLVNKDVLIAASSRLRNLRPANLYPYGLWNAWELWLER